LKTVYAPNYVDRRGEGVQVFLAGSIEMGKAAPWRQIVTTALEPMPEVACIYNPRRPNFDAYQEQSVDNPYFSEQVNWELDNISSSDVVYMYLQPGTQSPISLAELGLCLASMKELVVCCPPGFWRKGNVDIMCSRYGVPVYKTFEISTVALKNKILDIHTS
jgi:hypothetical protein